MNRYQKPAITRTGNRSAALTAVTIGNLEKLDVGLIARCHGLAETVVQDMISARREREAGFGQSS